MRNFLLSLFIIFNLINQEIKDAFSNLIFFLSYVGKSFLTLINFIYKVIKIIISFLRKLLWEYVVLVFIGCLYINFKYKDWYYTDYIWILFFVTFIIALVIYAVKKS